MDELDWCTQAQGSLVATCSACAEYGWLRSRATLVLEEFTVDNEPLGAERRCLRHARAGTRPDGTFATWSEKTPRSIKRYVQLLSVTSCKGGAGHLQFSIRSACLVFVSCDF